MKKIFVTATLVRSKAKKVERKTVVHGPDSEEATQVVTRVLHVTKAAKIH